MYNLREANNLEWDKLIKQCNHVNLLQLWEYGQVKQIIKGWRPSRYIINDGCKQVGLVQVLNKSLPLLGGFACINRGPLILCDTAGGNILNETVKNVMLAIYQELVENKGYCLVIAPELEKSEENLNILKSLGFRDTNGQPWSSSVLDLLLDEDVLFKKLHGKWRNLLRKSEKMGLGLEQTQTNEAMEFLMDRYNSMQKQKKFTGVPENILLQLKKLVKAEDQIQILFAKKEGIRVAGILTIGHGDSCTYLVGWNTSDGRKLQANYFLLWRAVLYFKNARYRWFDLGGIDQKNTPGVSHFKRGLGGKEYKLIGEFETFPRKSVSFILGTVLRFARKFVS